MAKQTILFLLSCYLLLSCKEGNTTQEQATIADTTTTAQQTPIAKEHPAEEKISFYLSAIERLRSTNEYDSLSEANSVLMEYLKELCLDETLLQYSLVNLENTPMQVLTSSDKKFRIYCWDTETGGSMHFYNAIAQYKTENGSAGYVLNDIDEGEEGDCGVWYNSIHTIEAGNNKTYYLPVYYGRFSGNDYSEGIRAYTIESGRLNNTARLFKPTGKPLFEISYYYHHGMSDKESADNSIHFSDDEKTLFIPITDKDDIITARSLVYKFDGNQFVFEKNKK